ncbi:hypothetical protein ApDm4_1519 [Acetobacter pomorum]|nr:hypothetical protein ApDm4_1519 [Acetobacter pomorum]
MPFASGYFEKHLETEVCIAPLPWSSAHPDKNIQIKATTRKYFGVMFVKIFMFQIKIL